jgi:hypothetical protein
LFDALATLGIDVTIIAKPYDNKSKTPFPDDHAERTYDGQGGHPVLASLVRHRVGLREPSARALSANRRRCSFIGIRSIW